MIYIACDHSGFELKNKIIEKLTDNGIKINDLTLNFDKEDDYPDVAKKLCEKIQEGDLGITLCGTGIGVCIASNKVSKIRAALCTDEQTAKMAREHNNANVLCLGALTKTGMDFDETIKIVNTFLNTPFSFGERHVRRIEKISEMEK